MTDFESWIEALTARHQSDLTFSEISRSLRALSSTYVERRHRLREGAALSGAGKRAAFALFYGPLHFLTITAIVRALGPQERRLTTIHDLGCGTGVGGAAWALASGTPATIAGIDRNPWAVAEANWTYRQLELRGTARAGDIAAGPRLQIPGSQDSGILLAYSVNELPDAARAALLDRIADAAARGSALLVVEPIAKRDRRWWPAWASRLAPAGVVEHEWRFPADLPPLLRDLARSAGLDPRELTARTLSRH